MDTHTAAGYKVYKDTKEDDTYSVLLSTASPYKFSKDVYLSLIHILRLCTVKILNTTVMSVRNV